MINNRQNGRRRGRNGPQQVRGPGNGQDRGNRIDNRARGNAAQLHEKYKNLARDTQLSGDRVMTEYYLQFADHYFRVLSESRARFEDQNQGQQQRRARYETDEFDEQNEDGEGSDEGGEMDPRMADQRRYEPREPQQQDQRPRREAEGRYEQQPRREREERGHQERGAGEERSGRDRDRSQGYQDRGQQDRNQSGQDRPERAPRRERIAREAPRELPLASADPVQAEVPQDAASAVEPVTEEAPRPRRGRRPRRVEAEAGDVGEPQRIESDRLPPAFAEAPAAKAAEAPAAKDAAEAAPAEGDGEAPAQRRRRTRRTAASTEDSNVAA